MHTNPKIAEIERAQRRDAVPDFCGADTFRVPLTICYDHTYRNK